MLLSIAMIVKDEEKYLDKTLNALIPLMKKISSELIILDTGSKDNTVEIAKKYTDKVYIERWNGNFSDMRNKSIKYANGDWILILDADEELINYNKLLQFFNSDMHKKYNTASIELRNLQSIDKTKYTNSYIARCFRNDEDFKYTGIIHEQPSYKQPIYYNIASFNHYGYMFEDEELKQKKFKRNIELLFLELDKEKNDPYIYYQIGKTYVFAGRYNEAINYMEKSYRMYESLNILPPYIYCGLAKTYLALNKYKKCEEVCLQSISNDDKNIDIYYYLAQAQQKLNKLEDSLKHYNKYVFLVDNYETSTQANNLCCESDTSSLYDNVILEIIKIYYNLEDFEEVNKRSSKLGIKEKKKIYTIIINSLYKSEKLEEIKKLYNTTTNSLVENKDFMVSIESILIGLKKQDKINLCKLISDGDSNYAILNNIRLGLEVDLSECNRILKEENHAYYGDIIYYAIKQNINLTELLRGVNDFSIQNYFNYIIAYRRNIILKLYEYLINEPYCLSLEKLVVYKNLSKALLFGSELIGTKYENILFMYISYTYDYLKHIYNTKLSDNELINFINDEDYQFVIQIVNLEKLKKNNKLEYIKQMKQLLAANQQYEKAITVFSNKFNHEFNEDEELKYIKTGYKIVIEKMLNEGDLKSAEENINKYEYDFARNADILNLKGILNILKGDFKKAEMIFKEAYLIDRTNNDIIFNIACTKEALMDYCEAYKFLNYIVNNVTNEEIINEAKEKIKDIKKIY